MDLGGMFGERNLSTVFFFFLFLSHGLCHSFNFHDHRLQMVRGRGSHCSCLEDIAGEALGSTVSASYH